MEAQTSTVTLENKPGETNPEKPEGSKDAPKSGSGSGSGSGSADSGKGKDAKPTPAPERKKGSKLSEDKRFKLFSGTANPKLAQAIGEHIGVKVGEAKMQRFADGEVYFQLLENVRGVDVFVAQPTCYPVD